MDLRIRDFRPDDEQEVVELSVRAWTPVFESLQRVLGGEIFVRLHGEWPLYQASAVRDAIAANGARVWVAEASRSVVGFTAAQLDTARAIGEIQMLAVDPGHQRRGVARALTDRATEWFRSSWIKVAMVETGGDPAHGAARRLYENEGYTPAPVARYFKAL
jgi:GNAT superfamily N-acetyltransferase